MMDRRIFLATVAGLLVTPLAAEAQRAGKVYRVAIVFQSSPVSDMAGPEPTHPLLRVFVCKYVRRTAITAPWVECSQ